ncbi:MAG: peptide ABC transporter substrate-binding protein [Pseudomonadales bacterium]
MIDSPATGRAVPGSRPALARLAAVLLALTFAAAGLHAAPASSDGGRVVRIALPGEPETLDPHRYNLRLEETILTDLFLGLTTFSADGRIVPGAAESWTVSEDGLVWTFTLREGLAWSDGVPLTADDFVYSFRRLEDPATAASLAYFMYPLKNAEAVNGGRLPVEALGVEAPDARTLRLILEKPYPYLPERLLYPTGYPVPRHVLERVGDDWVKPAYWVSNGAYRLVDWQPQAQLVLEASPAFPGHGLEAPAITRLIYQPLASEQSAYNRYRSGEVHAIGAFPGGELPKVQRELQADLRLSPLLSIMYLVFNTRQAPFDDPRVREALALVVERETLTDKVQRVGNLPSASFVPALVADYQPVPVPFADAPVEARRTRARALLAAAGYGPERPLNVTLRYISGAEAKRTNLAIAAFWKQIGVATELHQAELKVHFADLRQGDFQVAIAGWFGESNPEHYLGLLGSTAGSVNYGGYSNPRFDELLAQASAEGDLIRRNGLLQQAERVGIAEFPVVPLYSVMVRRLVHPQLEGWAENARDAHPARFLRWH